MVELKGKFNNAKVFTDNIESEAISQIIELCNQEFVKDSIIRIMPDTHAGAGCTIGTTITIKDKIVPNLVGVDIGCGMTVAKLSCKEVNLPLLDKIIRTYIPSGFNIREKEHKNVKLLNLNDLKCCNYVNIQRAKLSIGTLGGGNHFIELNKDDEGDIYLVIHSGSRNLGKNVAEYYQNLAYKKFINMREEKRNLIQRLKKQGKEKEIQIELKKLQMPKINKQLAYVYDNDFNDYIHDMKIVQEFATLNRETIMYEILKHMNLRIDFNFTTIHNYIDTKNMILRKGAISAQNGELMIIPMNMRDGSLICIGKGNSDWNYSAPHGAGRIMSRSKAKELISIEEFKESMKNIWSTSVGVGTLDESPMVYKPMQEIIDNIKDTVEITNIIKPLYNFKAN